MGEYTVFASRKGGASEEHEIVGVCGDMPGGYASKATVYDMIGAGHLFWSFNPEVANVPRVSIRQLLVGTTKCIQTQADRYQANNLLQLPDGC